MTAVAAHLLPAYSDFQATPDFFGMRSHSAHRSTPSTCGRITRAIRLWRSTGVSFLDGKTHPSVGLFDRLRHSSSGILTWSMIGSVAIDSGVFGVPTFPRTTDLRTCTDRKSVV